MGLSRSQLAAQAAQRLFPPGAEVSACAIGSADPLWPIERAAIAAAVPARQAEFGAGRTAARAAIVALGLPAVAIPSLASRAPGWPPGIAGSISHADGIAMAVVVPSRQCASVGLDIEPDALFPEDLVEHVTLPEERAWLARQDDPRRMARLLFTAKEAAYKCQFPKSQALFGFNALRIEIDTSRRRLQARFLIDVPPFEKGTTINGSYTHAQGLVIAGFQLCTARANLEHPPSRAAC